MNAALADLQAGLQLHQQGRVADAIAVYERILRSHPDNHDALHYLGVGYKQTGRTEEAVGLLASAVRLKPDNPACHNNLGSAYLALGRFDQALACFDQAIRLAPRYAMAHNNRGVVLAELHRYEESILAYHEVTTLEPGHADAFYNMGVVLQVLGRFDEAQKCYGNAIDLLPGHFEARINRAYALIQAGDFPSALAESVAALRLRPESAEAHHNRGVALAGLARHEEGLKSQETALRFNPSYVQAWLAQGAALEALKRNEEALASYARALALEPDLADAWSGHGRILSELERFDEAEVSLNRAVSLAPGDATNWFNRAYALTGQGRHDAALSNLDQGLSIAPDIARAHNHRGNTLRCLHRLAEAEASYRRAIALLPGYVEAHVNLGVALAEQGQLQRAVACYREALAWNPAFAEAHCNLGDAARRAGRPDDAAMHYKQALQLKPDFALAYSNLLYVHAYHAIGSKSEYLELARGWERACMSATLRAAARSRIFRNPPRAGRRLKVGYVSGDFRQHSVSYFFEQLLTHHRRDQVELYAYFTHEQEDAVTARLRALVDHWVPAATAKDAALRDRIESDGIDVLIDLSGHTAHGRQGVFARRAAPVQAHYLGYFASTGLSEMDYWIGDGITTPEASDADFCEKIWRLPRVWVSYEGKDEAPAPDRQPRQGGVVWLGSFNSLGKVTPATLDAWAGILRALPEGRLLLKARELAETENRMRVLQAMESGGVDRERVELLDWNATPDWQSHMACYNRLDVALDPIGAVGGGTTTCDALWMAVPVVALQGDRMASRMTESMLDAVGHSEWIASSRDDYMQKVVDLARSPDRCNALRASLRQQMAASPLCDARDLALRLEEAYLEMYDRWWLNKNERR